MSKGQQATLPSPDVAYSNLFDGVHANVFFGKLASAGIQPLTEKEASDLLELAGTLRDIPLEKEASDHDSRFGGALGALHGVLSDHGADGHIKAAAAAESGMAIKQAAAELARDPAFYNSVLSLKAFEASQMAEQFQGQ